MKRKMIMAVTVGIMCFSLISCNGAETAGEKGHDAAEGEVSGYEVIDWEDDPTIGKVQAGCYQRVSITKKDETYEEMLELRDMGNKGDLIIRDDGTATFEFDGEKTEYLYDEFNFYLSEDTEKANGIPYVYIGGRLITNDGSMIIQYLKLTDEELEAYHGGE